MAVINVKYKNGAFGSIESATSVYPAMSKTLALYGENGTIVLKEQKIKQFETLDGEIEIDKTEQKAGSSDDPTNIASASRFRILVTQ